MAGANGTILIIDDYDSVRIAISMILSRHGFKVITAANPAEAKKIWAQHRSIIDLLLVDISMPIMSGPELVQELLADGASVPVIFATGTGPENAKEATKDIPHPTILQKPFSPDVLVNAIRNALSKQAALLAKA